MLNSTNRVFAEIEQIIRIIADRKHGVYELKISGLLEKEKLDRLAHLLMGMELDIKMAYDKLAVARSFICQENPDEDMEFKACL